MDKDEIYLGEIREFCQKIIGFMANLSYEQFLDDEKLQLAVVKLIENSGEASRRLSETCRASHPGVDWRKAMAMRNRLVHDYMDVDLAIVFDTTKVVP